MAKKNAPKPKASKTKTKTPRAPGKIKVVKASPSHIEENKTITRKDLPAWLRGNLK